MHFYQQQHDLSKRQEIFNHGLVGVYDNLELSDIFTVHKLKIATAFLFTYDIDSNFVAEELIKISENPNSKLSKIKNLHIITDANLTKTEYQKMVIQQNLMTSADNVKIYTQKSCQHSKIFLLAGQFLEGPQVGKSYFYMAVSTANLVNFHWGEKTCYSNLTWVSPLYLLSDDPVDQASDATNSTNLQRLRKFLGELGSLRIGLKRCS